MLTIANRRYREVSKDQLLRELRPLMYKVAALESELEGFPATFLYIDSETEPRFIIASEGPTAELVRYKRLDIGLVG
jgi:hypothetical protein